jgi:transmembrane sensor
MTSTHPVPSSPGAQREAAHWAALLDRGTLNEADRAALDQWLNASPEHRPLLSRYCQLSADLETALPELLRAGTLDIPAVASAARPWWRQAVIPLTAAAAVLALGVFFFSPREASTPDQDIATLARERSTVSLVDGSRIDLNARTRTVVHYDGARRQVRLIAGEALFAVAKNPDRPFIVGTPAGEVMVTGTRFNVRLVSETDFEVTVLEGTVRVRPPGATEQPDGWTLHLGDQLLTHGPRIQLLHLGADSLNDVVAWQEGRVVFEGTPLAAAAARFARYHGTAIDVSPDVSGRTVGGRFSLDDLSGFLTALEQALPVRTERMPDGSVHIGQR